MKRPWLPAALVVAVSPWIFDPWGWDRFSPARWLAATTLVLGAVICLLGRGAFDAPRRLALLWMVAVAVAVVAAAASQDPLLGLLGDDTRLYGVLTIGLLAAAFAVGCSAGSGSDEPVTVALLAGALPVILYGLLQMAHLDPLHWPAALDVARARSSFGNADLLGGYLTLVVPIAIGTALRSCQRGWRRRLAVGVAGGGLVVLIGSGTRGAWIGTAAGLVVLAYLSPTAIPKRARVGVVCAAIALLAAVPAAAAIGVRSGRSADVAGGTAAGRVSTWAVAARAIGHQPLFGFGPDEFRRGIESNLDPGWVRRYGVRAIPDRAHNLFLDQAGTTGIVGLVVVAALLLTLTRRIRTNARTAPATAAIAAGLIAYVVHEQFLFDTFDLGVLFWVLAGCAATSAGVARVSRRVAQRRALWIATPLAVAVFAWASLGVVADHRVGKAVAVANVEPNRAVAIAAGALSLRPRSLTAALEMSSIAVRSRNAAALRRAHLALRGWHDADVVLADADVLAALGARLGDDSQLGEAIAKYRRVLASQPFNALAWLGLGESTAGRGDLRSARLAFRRAADLLPNSVDPVLDLGLVELAAGDVDAATRALKSAKRISPRDPRVADLARQIVVARTSARSESEK